MMAAQQQEVVRPAHTVRFGNLKGTIWKNDTKNGPMYNVTFVRSYREGEEWKDSGGFGYEDLLVIGKIADECHTWIHHTMARQRTEPEGQADNQRPQQQRRENARK